jgi:hypothetical protein
VADGAVAGGAVADGAMAQADITSIVALRATQGNSTGWVKWNIGGISKEDRLVSRH